jgi:hypothetical protein
MLEPQAGGIRDVSFMLSPPVPMNPASHRFVISASMSIVGVESDIVVCRLQGDVAVTHDLLAKIVDTVQGVNVVITDSKAGEQAVADAVLSYVRNAKLSSRDFVTTNQAVNRVENVDLINALSRIVRMRL